MRGEPESDDLYVTIGKADTIIGRAESALGSQAGPEPNHTQ